MRQVGPWVYNTDYDWFQHLSRLGRYSADGAVVDEVNFWSPTALRPMSNHPPGTPVFLRLKKPRHCIAGVASFASWFVARNVYDAWDLMGERNGTPTLARLGRALRRDFGSMLEPVGCMLLRNVCLWPDAAWLPWGDARSWRDQIVRGRQETRPDNVAALLGRVAGTPADLGDRFVLADVDHRQLAERTVVQREGQGVFRARLLDAYGRRCAITGEHTEPVLQAAHIQPYLGPASNHVQNGMLMVAEFHTLFDRGLVTIEPPGARSNAYRVRVSKRIRELWDNGHRYNGFDGRELVAMPARAEWRPSVEALEWHRENRYEKVA